MIGDREFAAFTRRAIETHTEWDSLHAFLTLTEQPAGRIHVMTYMAIAPDVHPEEYPMMMAGAAAKDGLAAAAGYLLQIEAHGVTEPGPDASPIERAAFDHARRHREFHKLPDAVESAVAYCTDTHGQLWVAAKIRGREAEGIGQHYYAADRLTAGGDRIGGQMVDGLIAVGRAAGRIQAAYS